MAADANQDQKDAWSNAVGQVWAENDAVMDTTLAPVLDHLLVHADLQAGERVLDIGCGTGLSTIKAAQAVGAGGQATGADIADQMVAKARVQAGGASNVIFMSADAQTHGFETAAFDVVISRFGVMFFADPAAAFANIARAVKPGGRMVFMAWADAQDNPWFSVPRAVAVAQLGPVEPPLPHAPGPMGLADRDYTLDVFARAGLSDVTITPVALDLTPPGTADDMGAFALVLGPASRIFKDLHGTQEDAAAIVATVAERFQGYETKDGLRVPARLNRIEVRCRGAS
ncbi:MAG: methyltransferase domain-containing protein [Pseudomonadota bacterium]